MSVPSSLAAESFRSASLLVRPLRASPDTPRPGTQARRSGQARNDQLAAEIPLRRRTKVAPLRFCVKDFLNRRSVAAADQLAERTDHLGPLVPAHEPWTAPTRDRERAQTRACACRAARVARRRTAGELLGFFEDSGSASA